MLVLAMDKTMAQKVENKPPAKQNQVSESSLNTNSLGVDENSEKQRPVKKQKTVDTNATATMNNNPPSSNLLEMLPSLNFEKVCDFFSFSNVLETSCNSKIGK